MKKQKKSTTLTAGLWIVAVVALVAVGTIVLRSSTPAPEQTENTVPPPTLNDPTPKDLAPAFSLKDVAGKTVSLSDSKGKVVLIDFWATWCPPCRRGIPDLVDLYGKYKNVGFQVIGISVDQEPEKVAPFVSSNKIPYPILYADGQVTNAYGGIESIPTTFIVDRKGQIRERLVGLHPKEQLETIIKQLLAEK